VGSVRVKPEAVSRSIGMLRIAIGDRRGHARLKWNIGNEIRPVSDCCDHLSRHHRRSCDAQQLRILALADSDLHVGLGLTTPKNALRLALPPQPSTQNSAEDVCEITLAPLCAHSREPNEACEWIQRCCDGTCLDLFAANEKRAVTGEDGDAA
jgi:hypothetical protein